ncbi:hypothetical protein ABZT47_38550 [Sphaerisporangium sp. NPDC005289]|uniref:hypothetical protein n=1 Tax=Sphaerisporangium sp. NPDC005289 TaxID=3155247 RepID=UPI0033AD81A5
MVDRLFAGFCQELFGMVGEQVGLTFDGQCAGLFGGGPDHRVGPAESPQRPTVDDAPAVH